MGEGNTDKVYAVSLAQSPAHSRHSKECIILKERRKKYVYEETKRFGELVKDRRS